MQRLKFHRKKNVCCKNFVLILAFCWILSIGSGCFLASFSQDLLPSWMHSVVTNQVSIVGLAVVVFLPIGLSAVAVRFSVPWIIYLIAVVKGISYGFSIYFLLISFLDAGWLVSVLLMFSDTCMLIPLFLFWVRHINGTRHRLKSDILSCLILAGIISCIDYFGISPFILTMFG